MNKSKIKRLVGKYEVGRTIGEGTFAKVKFAKNTENGEPVALKILDKEKVLKHKMAEQVCHTFFRVTSLNLGRLGSLNMHTLFTYALSFWLKKKVHWLLCFLKELSSLIYILPQHREKFLLLLSCT